LRSKFALLSALIIIAFLPATSQAYVIQTITEVGNQNLDAWRCKDIDFSTDSGILSISSLAACGGAVGELAGQGSASASATPGVVRAIASFEFTNGPGTDQRDAESTAQVKDELTVTFPDSNIHYVVFTVTLGGSAMTEGVSGTSASAGIHFDTGLAGGSIQEGYGVTPGNSPTGSLGTFSATADVKSGNIIKTNLTLTAFASVKGVGSASANFGSSAHLTVAVFTDVNLTNQLAPSQFSVVGETGLDYATLVVPEPSTALFLGFGLVFMVRRRSSRR